jgi:hypothetical protein
MTLTLTYLLVIHVYIDLPIAAFQIEGGKPFGSCQRVQDVVDQGQWKAVTLFRFL